MTQDTKTEVRFSGLFCDDFEACIQFNQEYLLFELSIHGENTTWPRRETNCTTAMSVTKVQARRQLLEFPEELSYLSRRETRLRPDCLSVYIPMLMGANPPREGLQGHESAEETVSVTRSGHSQRERLWETALFETVL